MTTVELTKEETKVLQEILESCLSEVQLECGDITTQGFREELQMKETFIRSMLGRLTAGDVEDFLSDGNCCPAICCPSKQFHRWRH